MSMKRRSRLAMKSLHRLCVLLKFFGKKLQRDKSPEPGILGPVNDTHPAAAQLFKNAIMRDGLSDHDGIYGSSLPRRDFKRQ